MSKGNYQPTIHRQQQSQLFPTGSTGSGGTYQQHPVPVLIVLDVRVDILLKLRRAEPHA